MSKPKTKRYVLGSVYGVAPTITSHIAKDGVYNMIQKGAFKGTFVLELITDE